MAQLPKRLKDNRFLLYSLYKANPNLRKAIIKHSNPGLIKAISEISLNTLKGNIATTPASKRKLQKYKNKLRCLACRKRSLNSKRRILVQEGGFLPTLIGTLLSGIIGSLLQK